MMRKDDMIIFIMELFRERRVVIVRRGITAGNFVKQYIGDMRYIEQVRRNGSLFKNDSLVNPNDEFLVVRKATSPECEECELCV